MGFGKTFKEELTFKLTLEKSLDLYLARSEMWRGKIMHFQNIKCGHLGEPQSSPDSF